MNTINCWVLDCQTQAVNQIAGTACCVDHVGKTVVLACAIAKGDKNAARWQALHAETE